MPKNKTHKGLLKRVTITGRGKIKWQRAGKSHLNGNMSGKQGRQLRSKRTAKAADVGRIASMLHRPLTKGDRD